MAKFSTEALVAMVVEQWGFAGDAKLKNCKGACLCMACQHFAYGLGQRCHTLVGCNLRQKQLQQGEHLTKRCS